MDFLNTPAPAASSAPAEGLATSRFDRAAALLRSAGSTVARTAGAPFAGGSRDGGVPTDGGESNSSLFRSLGGFVTVVPGGFGGGEASSRGGGTLFGKDGDTILGSAEASSVASRRSGPITRGGVILTPSHVVAGFSLLYLFSRVTLEGGLAPQSAWQGSHSKVCLRRDPVWGADTSRLIRSSSSKAPLYLPFAEE
jgi:hypothetical protein